VGSVRFLDARIFRFRINVQKKLLKVILGKLNNFQIRRVDVFLKSKTRSIEVALQSYAICLEKTKN